MLERYIRQLIEAHRTPEVDDRLAGRRADADGARVLPPGRGAGQALRPARHDRPHTIQTNGTLLDDDWARFFAENGFLVGLSIDGPRELHDAYRRDKGGRPTFDKVMRGLAALREHGVEWNALTTVTPPTRRTRPRSTASCATSCGASSSSSSPSSSGPCEDGVPYGDAVTDRSVTPDGLGRFLIGVFDEWVRRDVGEVYVQLFDVALANWYGEPAGLCVHSRHLRHRPGDGVQRRRVRLRPLRRAGVPAREHPRAGTSPSSSARREQRAFGEDKHDRAAALLPRVRRALRLPRRLPQGPLRRARRTASRGSTTSAPATRPSSTTSTRR